MKNKTELIRMLLNKNAEIHSRINNTIEAILRERYDEEKAHAEVESLCESLNYVIEEIMRIKNI